MFIKRIEVSYAGYYNGAYGHVGHLFQNRYKSEAIKNNAYFLNALRYILRNPEAAGICSWNLYQWSSAKCYLTHSGGITKMHVKIFTDGAARGNPDGPGGYGAILEYVSPAGKLYKKELSGAYEKTTNNRMELMAAIVALEELNRPCEVELYSDSKYLTDAFNQHWIDGWIRKGWMRNQKEPVKNISLWKRLLSAMEGHSVTFIWVKGHAGFPQNERCDELATYAADHGPWMEDPGDDLL